MDEILHGQHIHGADVFFALLYKFGVRRIFGIPGDELEIFDALSHSKIEFITTRHEQGAAFMAEATGKMTSLPGICISTLGPGATNLVTGVANAYQNRVPMIVLSGQLERKLHKDVPLAHQYVDFRKLFSPITKETFVIKSIDSIPSVLQSAVDKATTDRKGPVHLTLPFDVMEKRFTGKLSALDHPHIPQLPPVNLSAVHRSLALLKNAEFPAAFWVSRVILFTPQ